ncbi:vegetative cell wall protein gp1-like [Sorghum bicolor]|uniref:vegetative cell wall protein gp1-like n=1 Tax=Sorghum bicolor TaxID=4558 RepID=UPI000B425627|nr:vegetative cell wall protein gp1-like [Sorghum bicolor]|eukprot:XP_021311903.1 vegetative cell wall protein gp1-like [Sorghum bicolor]
MSALAASCADARDTGASRKPRESGSDCGYRSGDFGARVWRIRRVRLTEIKRVRSGRRRRRRRRTGSVREAAASGDCGGREPAPAETAAAAAERAVRLVFRQGRSKQSRQFAATVAHGGTVAQLATQPRGPAPCLLSSARLALPPHRPSSLPSPPSQGPGSAPCAPPLPWSAEPPPPPRVGKAAPAPQRPDARAPPGFAPRGPPTARTPRMDGHPETLAHGTYKAAAAATSPFSSAPSTQRRRSLLHPQPPPSPSPEPRAKPQQELRALARRPRRPCRDAEPPSRSRTAATTSPAPQPRPCSES